MTSGRTALVLSGGLGTRLRGVIGERQKVVSEPGGRVFLARVLDDLAAQGIGHAVLCAGYRSDEVEALARSYTKMRVSVSVEPEPRGTAGALGFAFAQLPELRAAGAVLVLNGDTFCETDVSSIFATHARAGADVTVVLARVRWKPPPNTDIVMVKYLAVMRAISTRLGENESSLENWTTQNPAMKDLIVALAS